MRDKEAAPYTFALSESIQNTELQRPHLILCDSGSQTSWFNANSLPPDVQPTLTSSIHGVTMAGEFNSNKQMTLQNVVLPEICHDIVLPELQACSFSAPCCCNIILGCDALCHFEVNSCFADNAIKSSLCRIPVQAFPDNFSNTTA